MMNRLTIKNGPHQGRRFSLKDPEMMVGRGEQAGICLDDPDVDEVHLILLQENDQLCISSVVPGRAVLVNGVEAGDGVRLKSGDELTVGSTQLVYTSARFYTGISSRRTGKMQRVTVGAVIIVLVLEALFIFGFSTFRHNQPALDLMRENDPVVEKEVVEQKTSEMTEIPPPLFSISKTSPNYTSDDQANFEICMIRIDFKSQRELTDEELKQVRVSSYFLEKVGTNEWSEPSGFMPASDWQVHQRDQRRDRFYCLSTVLYPRDPLAGSDEAAAFTEDVQLGATLRVFFGDELKDEEKIKLQLKNRRHSQSPNV